ncbi:MAG TPA: LuxR C-terminal-related transcriptional regulator [Thermomicrobiales bacterium]
MTSLPAPTTSFVGREREVEEIATLLARHEVRALTLTGPPGIGKTRLALAAASAVAPHFSDGVVFVDLAPLSTAEQFLPQLAAVLGSGDSKDGTARGALIAHLCKRRLLLLLDNFETVIGAAADLASLLASCAGVKALVTSRTRLASQGERVLTVAPLPLPANGTATESSDAVRLFVERARAAAPGLALTPETRSGIAEICRRLEGIPLAIELAAARMRTLTPTELLGRLDDQLAVLDDGPGDAPNRLRTMRDAVAWSFRLLSPDLQALLRRLSVFRGGFDVPAAEAVSVVGFGEADRWDQAASGNPAPLVHRLNLLVDHNLIRFASAPGSPRYAMLEAVREFAWERLAAAGKLATAQRAHADYFLALAERTRPLLFTRAFLPAMATLVADQHNCRAALAWAREAGESRLALRLCTALQEFWYQCGFVAEGRARVEAALAMGGGTPAERQVALSMAGLLAWLQGDNDHAARRYGEALAVAETLGNRWLTAITHNGLALVAWRTGDAAAIRRHSGGMLPTFRETGDAIQEALALVILAIADRLDGQLDDAARLFDQGRRVAEQTGFLWLAAAAHFGSGEVALDRDRDAEAVGFYRDSLAITADLGDRWGIGAAIGGLACVAARRGDDASAARLFAAADALLASGRTFLPTLNVARYNRLKTEVEQRLGAAAFRRHEREGSRWSVEEAVAAAALVTPDRPVGVSAAGPVKLTERQRQILRYVSEGLTSHEIADKMGVSEVTVNFHIGAITRKLGVPSRAAAAVRAARDGLI